MALVGAAAMIEASQRPAEAAPPTLFASHQSPKSAAEEIVGAMESRGASPMPFAGDGFMPEEPGTEAAPPSRIDVVPPARPDAPSPRQDFRALTSFDEHMEMTSGAPDRLPPKAPRPFPPATPRWNNPVQWIGTHQSGL